MRGVNLLSDRAVQAAIKKAGNTDKVVTVNDGAGLTLEAQPSGAGWWRLRYWKGGKAARLSVGTYLRSRCLTDSCSHVCVAILGSVAPQDPVVQADFTLFNKLVAALQGSSNSVWGAVEPVKVESRDFLHCQACDWHTHGNTSLLGYLREVGCISRICFTLAHFASLTG